MSYLLDTNVLSELRRPTPQPQVVAWVDAHAASTLYLSVLTLGELRKGVLGLPDGNRRRRLLDWLEVDLPQFFIGRILPIDERVAEQWGQLAAQAGRPLPVIDSLLAATAMVHGLVLVTRNVRDFVFPGLELNNPWDSAPG